MSLQVQFVIFFVAKKLFEKDDGQQKRLVTRPWQKPPLEKYKKTMEKHNY
jgi:hypothetical protein